MGGGGPPGRRAGRPALRRYPPRAAGRRRPPLEGRARARRVRRRLHAAALAARVQEADPHHPAHGVPGHVRVGDAAGRAHRAVHPARSELRVLRHQPRADAAPLRLRRRGGDGAAVPDVHLRLGGCAVRAGPGDRPTGLVGHERPAHQGLPAPAAAVPRLLHRGEGRRRDEPHDERHREPAAAAAGRPGPVRHSGADDGRHHDLPLRHQRHPGRHHGLRRPTAAGHHVDLVQAGLRARVRQGARRHRAGAGGPLREPAGRAHRRARTTGSATTSRPTATSWAPTATPTTTRGASTVSTGRAPRSSASSASC